MINAYTRILAKVTRFGREIEGQADWENVLTAHAYDVIAEDEDEPEFDSFQVHALVNKAIAAIKSPALFTP